VIKCISIRQPWASLIVRGEKRIENRTWATRYVGPLLIHAAARRPRGGGDDPGPLGAIVGACWVAGCLPIAEVRGLIERVAISRSQEPFAAGPLCWLLLRARAFARPIPYRGQLGLFGVPESVLPARDPVTRWVAELAVAAIDN